MFSILIPTFNNLKYLEICIKSLKKNSKFDHEIHLPTIKWKSRNSYYVDNSGNILVSIQEIHPMMPEMRLTFFYK